MSDTYDYLFKFLIIGNAGTGKTCLLRRFLDDSFREESLHTIGVEFGTKIVQVGGKSLKLQIWDTAGQERFQCVTRSYYRGAAGALVVYDITCRESFNRVADWVASARELARPELVIILVGNKLDLSSESREISELEARKFAEENGVAMFLETSAKSGDNVQEAFLTAARTVLERVRASNTADTFCPSTPGSVSAGVAGSHDSRPGCFC